MCSFVDSWNPEDVDSVVVVAACAVAVVAAAADVRQNKVQSFHSAEEDKSRDRYYRNLAVVLPRVVEMVFAVVFLLAAARTFLLVDRNLGRCQSMAPDNSDHSDSKEEAEVLQSFDSNCCHCRHRKLSRQSNDGYCALNLVLRRALSSTTTDARQTPNSG